VRGELGVRSLTERPDLRFAVGAELMLGADENSLRRVKVEQARPHKQGFLLRLDYVADCDGAEKIRGWGLFIPVEEAAEPLEKSHYYHHQLIGMTVRDCNLGELGRVVALAETPANDLLEIARPGKPSFYLPLISQFVSNVDIEAGEIETDVPAGLMET
jgi:16S rRNA processing protein RimM